MARRDPVFWTERTGSAVRSLRRFTLDEADHCTEERRYHHASTPIGEFQLILRDAYIAALDPTEYAGDERWPTTCAACGRLFTDDDRWQVQQEPIYGAADGRHWPQRDLPPGAMYDAEWLPDSWKGSDGIGLTVILPDNTPWHVDSRASNCTMKETDPTFSLHKCWVRTGDPRSDPPVVTVSKAGPTCAAGAGSIASPGYHGFLTDGALIEC